MQTWKIGARDFQDLNTRVFKRLSIKVLDSYLNFHCYATIILSYPCVTVRVSSMHGARTPMMSDVLKHRVYDTKPLFIQAICSQRPSPFAYKALIVIHAENDT